MAFANFLFVLMPFEGSVTFRVYIHMELVLDLELVLPLISFI